jgi:hypothetical protein
MEPEYAFWLAVHRGILAIAKAIEIYKLRPHRRSKPSRTD